jgi:hypothetical protein
MPSTLPNAPALATGPAPVGLVAITKEKNTNFDKNHHYFALV